MNSRAINSILIIMIIILLLSVYWFLPENSKEFIISSNYNSNFSLNSYSETPLQFYENMRFPEKRITYRIENCPLQRKNDMEYAFEIMEEKTVLEFYPVSENEQITITCNDSKKHEGRLFIAGEGGPTNITSAGNFNVIEAGKILLIKDSNCERPNIAIHELLHVLGFDHSENPKNIMYEISRCDQVIGEDLLNFINDIYYIPSNPDLFFEDANVKMNGRYLDANFSIRNNGLKRSGESVVRIIADGKEVKQIEIPPIEIGYGRRVYLERILINRIDVKGIELIIDNDFDELETKNNAISFEIKK